jgi:LEA14-like dessication related protein
MKALKPILIFSGLGVIGFALYRYYQKQINFLKDIQYKIIGIKIANISKDDVALDITQRVYNASNVEAVVTEVYLDIYLDGIKVGNINEIQDIVILPTKSTDVSYRFSFNPTLILKNIVNLVTLTLKLKDLRINAEGYVKVHSGFIYTTIPFSYENNLKSLLK